MQNAAAIGALALTLVLASGCTCAAPAAREVTTERTQAVPAPEPREIAAESGEIATGPDEVPDSTEPASDIDVRTALGAARRLAREERHAEAIAAVDAVLVPR